MRRHRFLLAWILLVVFAAGGVSRPVAHQVQHAAERATAATDPSCHPSAVHNAEGAVWAGAGADLIAPECDLCATRLLVVLPTPVPQTVPHVVGTTDVERRSHVAAAHVAADQYIRGPPSLVEVRPA